MFELKRIFSVVISLLLLLSALPVSAVAVSEQTDEIIVNVKDFGAKGDGVTSDRTAILSAFSYAINHYASKSIPVTVYFPEGEYGLKACGMYVDMPFGSGNLTVKGDGADKSTIVYLDEWVNGGSWVALRFKTEGEPSSVDEYLHDITIQDLGVYDTDPVGHAWNTANGDPGTEETHGFNIQYCVRATIKNCKVDSVGDEAIDMTHCIDSQMIDNVVYNSPGAGSAGGAISVGDESKNVKIANNTIIGSINESSKTNWAIAVEALLAHIEDVTVENNIIQNMGGWGIHIGAPAGTISNVLVKNNVITDCRDGGIRTSSSGQTTNVQLIGNTISNTKTGIGIEGTNKDQTLIEDCVMEALSDCGISIAAPSSGDTVIRNSTIRNSQYRAVYNAGTNTLIDYVLMDGIGLSGSVTVGAITQYASSGSCTVSNTMILNCQNKKAVQSVQKVVNTYIEQSETSGYISISGANLIQNCRVNRIVQTKTESVIDGLVLSTGAALGTHAATVTGTGITITNGVFYMPTNTSRYAVYENGTSADNNTFTNNLSVGGKGVKVIGANSVGTDNFKASEGATESFRYCVADGQVTIIEALDVTMTELVIPVTIEGCPVVRIAPWAFALCDKLTKVTIPDSVIAIDANAFYGCDGLIDVYYDGNMAPTDVIAMGENNDALAQAQWHCPSDRYSAVVRHSVMDTDNGNGLAFRFELSASNVSTVRGNQVNLTNATIEYQGQECKLVGMGAVVTNNVSIGTTNLTLDAVNGVNVLDIPTVYLQAVESDSCVFATRVINIPSSALDKDVYARPYYIVEVNGEEVVVYGTVDCANCAAFM